MASDKVKSTPAPLETGDGQQQDDNIDDLGRGEDGKKQDQPTTPAGKDDKTSGTTQR